MIEIKRCNYITGDLNSVSYGLSKIINFLETAGRNPLFLFKPIGYSRSGSSLKSFIQTSKLEFNNRYEFQEIIDNKSNLFRVDLIVVDLLHLNSVSSVLDYKEMLDKVGVDYIIVSDKYHYKEGDDIFIYKIEKESVDTANIPYHFFTNNKYFISEKVGGWRSSLDDLIVSYRRDKKIDDIFGDNI